MQSETRRDSEETAASLLLGPSNRTAPDAREDAARCYSVTFVKSVRPMRSPTPHLLIREDAEWSRASLREAMKIRGRGEGEKSAEDVQQHRFRVTCPRRRERKGERLDIACG